MRAMKPRTKPITISEPVRFHDPLPEAVDVAVIGAGVIGICAALEMARRGLSVLVAEKGRVAGEQSSRNWGWIRQHGRDEAELPVMMEATRLWEEHDRATGGKTGFTRGGIMYLASSREKLDERAQWLEVAERHGLDTHLLEKDDLERLFNRHSNTARGRDWAGAAFTPSDARAEPWQAVPALAELAQGEGVSIRENCAARAISSAGGKVTGIMTEDGPVRCEQVVVAAGAWSSLFLQRHGISIPQLSVRSTVSRTAPMAEVFAGNGADETLAFRRRADGGYTISISNFHDLYLGPDAFRHFFKWLPVAKEHWHETRLKLSSPAHWPDHWFTKRRWAEDEASPFEFCRVLEPEPEMNRQEALRDEFAQRFPALGKPELLNSWAGMIDAMPDVVPIVDRVPALDGLILATGMSGHGFGIGPGFGKIIAQMAAGQTVAHDMTRFRFSRFSDGSKIVPGPAI